MKLGRIILIGLLLLMNFFLIDFPGAKIVLAGVLVTLIAARIYSRTVKQKVRAKRFMDSYRVFSGLTENSSLIISNEGHMLIHALQIIDYADLNISVKQNHYYIFSIDRDGSELITYPIFGRKRGKYKVGPSIVRFSDPLGINSFQVEIDTKHEVIIFPNILQVANMSYKSMQPFGAIKNKVPIFEDPSIMIGLKEYQFGDEIKKINWKVSARYDKFYVNTYQPSISSGSIILLNLNEDDYDSRNRDYYVERGIEVASSLIRELFILRQEVGLASNCDYDKTNSILATNVSKGEAHFTSLLQDLSLVETTQKIPLRNTLDPSVLRLSWGTSIYMVTPRLDEVSLYKLIDFYQSGHSVTVINVGSDINKELSLWNIGFQSFYARFEGNIIHLMRI